MERPGATGRPRGGEGRARRRPPLRRSGHDLRRGDRRGAPARLAPGGLREGRRLRAGREGPSGGGRRRRGRRAGRAGAARRRPLDERPHRHDSPRRTVSQRRTIVVAASLLLLGNLASRVLGLVRELVIANFFGATVVTSAFQTASTVPTTFYDLVVGGAVSAALIPVLSGYAEADHPRELGRGVGTLLNGAAVLLGVLVVALLLLAAPLTVVLGVGVDRDFYATTVGFIRIVVPALFFLGLAGVAGAVCYARRWFTFPAVAIALYNLGLVATTMLFHTQ